MKVQIQALVLTVAAVTSVIIPVANATVIEGRNNRVGLDQRLISAIKRSVSSNGKCITVSTNPGTISLLAYNSSIRKAVKNGVNPKTTITATKITSRWNNGGKIQRSCTVLNGNGHHKVTMSNTPENWDAVYQEYRRNWLKLNS